MAAINSTPCSAQRRAQAIVAQLAPAVESTGLTTCDTAASSSSALTGPASSVQYGGLLAAQACLEQGVRFVFTLTGGHIAPILVGCEAVGIRVVDVRDEATTVFAADAISRLTGVPGVAIVTAGPGLTNTLTAVKNAQLAQSPLLVFAGATAMILKGRGSLQDIDQLALMQSAVKASWTIAAVRDIIPTIRKAFRVAQEGVPGPVFVEFPIEILWPASIIAEQIGVKDSAPLPFAFGNMRAALLERIKTFYLQRHLANVFNEGFTAIKPLASRAVPTVPVSLSAVRKVSSSLSQAKAPIMLIGSQAIKAGPAPATGNAPPPEGSPTHVADLRAAIERLGIPVFLSGMARGLLGAQHPLLLRHNRSKILRKADAVLLVGVPADFRLDYGQHIPKSALYFTVNLCAATLAKNNDIRSPNLRVHADPLEFVKRLAEMAPVVAVPAGVKPKPAADSDAASSSSSSSSSSSASPAAASASGGSSAWFSFLQSQQLSRESEIDAMANKESGRKLTDSSGGSFVNPLRLCRILDTLLPERSIIVADGGDFVGTASYTVKPRQPLSWLDPGVFGTLGVGAGFALAAKLACPADTVVLIWGDGASGFGLVEFDTYVRMGTPIIAIIGNDACWSQMYRDQIRLLKSAVATELAFTHYESVAVGFGGKGILVREESEMRPAFAQALEWTRQGFPVLINVMIAKSGFREGSISL